MRPKKAIASDSAEQRSAEAEMLVAFGARLGVVLVGKTYPIPGGAKLQIDGVCDQPPILCEVCAHHGSSKPGQRRKIIADAFKLVYADKVLGTNARKVILLADEDAAAGFRGRSWVAEAFSQLGIEVEVVRLSVETQERVRTAQVRQRR